MFRRHTRCTEVTADRELLKSDDHGLSTLATLGTIRKNMAELRIGKLVQTTGSTDGEVTPDVIARAEIELLKSSTGRLESSIGVLGRYANSHDMSFRTGLALSLGRARVGKVKVDLALSVRTLAIESTDISDTVQRQSHGDLELSGRKVDAGDHLGRRVLNLEPGVELKKVERVVRGGVKEFGRARGDVANKLRETHSGLLHLFERVGLCDGDGCLVKKMISDRR
jgi:hypothetical protein